ncbi:MAG: thermonuclease family protein [Candidatus Tectimicrobiota bacterium]
MAATMTPGLIEQMLAALHGAEAPWGPAAAGVPVTLRLDSAEDVRAVARTLEAWGAEVLRAEPAGPALQARVPAGRLWDLVGLDGVVEVAEGPVADGGARARRWAAVGVSLIASGLVIWWLAASDRLPLASVGPEGARTAARPARGMLPNTGVVAAVLAGDRLRLASGHHVRLAGVRAPAYHHPERGDELYGREAWQALAELVRSHPITLAYPSEPKAADGALRAFVSLPDGTDVNAALVERGAVQADLASAGPIRRATFGRLEAEARQARRGLWGGPIVGNRSSQVYHLPGGEFYHRVGPANQVFFATEAEAQAAGYRRSAR